MPFYDLRCTDCGEEFETGASVSDKTEKRIPCPACGSRELATVFKGAPYSLTKSSAGAAEGCPNRHVCGHGCAHGHA